VKENLFRHRRKDSSSHSIWQPLKNLWIICEFRDKKMSGGWMRFLWANWMGKALRIRHPERKAKNPIEMEWIPESACCS
jgi:hypothetical protein